MKCTVSQILYQKSEIQYSGYFTSHRPEQHFLPFYFMINVITILHQALPSNNFSNPVT